VTSGRRTSVLCAAHGLRYDPQVSSGCSRCVEQVEPRIGRRGLLFGAVAAVGTVAVGVAAFVARKWPVGQSQAALAPTETTAPSARAITYGDNRSGFVFIPSRVQGPRPLWLTSG